MVLCLTLVLEVPLKLATGEGGRKKNVLVIRTLEQTLKVATRKFVATTTL